MTGVGRSALATAAGGALLLVGVVGGLLGASGGGAPIAAPIAVPIVALGAVLAVLGIRLAARPTVPLALAGAVGAGVALAASGSLPPLEPSHAWLAAATLAGLGALGAVASWGARRRSGAATFAVAAVGAAWVAYAETWSGMAGLALGASVLAAAAEGGAAGVAVLRVRWVEGLGALSIGAAMAVPWVASGTGLLPEPEPPEDDIRQLRPELVILPGGTFLLGSPEGVGDSDSAEHPRHRVTVSSFAICRTEVTQGQWRAVMETEPSDCAYGCGDDLPVQNVSWLDAVEYLNALSDEEGLERCYARSGDAVTWPKGPSCAGYRLPTEAEWEYAARAGTTSAFSWGDDPSAAATYAWFEANSEGRVRPVATLEANPWQLYDVHGNVWEWVWDGYGPYPPAGTSSDLAGTSGDPAGTPGDRVDPTGPEEAPVRALRGGSFFVDPSRLRSANRVWGGPGYRNPDVGFRCVRSSPALP